MGLFDDIPEANTAPADNTEITTMILYFSTEELKEFRKLAKHGMKQFWPDRFKEDANITDFLLRILREKYNEELPA